MTERLQCYKQFCLILHLIRLHCRVSYTFKPSPCSFRIMSCDKHCTLNEGCSIVRYIVENAWYETASSHLHQSLWCGCICFASGLFQPVLQCVIVFLVAISTRACGSRADFGADFWVHPAALPSQVLISDWTVGPSWDIFANARSFVGWSATCGKILKEQFFIQPCILVSLVGFFKQNGVLMLFVRDVSCSHLLW